MQWADPEMLSAHDVLEAVREIVAARRVCVGDGIVRLAGPGGEWRVRYECRRGAGWDLKVSPPWLDGKARPPLSSVPAVHRELTRRWGLTSADDELAALVDYVFAAPPAGPREHLASLAIQQRWRGVLLARALRRVRATAGAAYAAACAARADALVRHPEHHAPVTVHLHTRQVSTEAEVLAMLTPPPAAAAAAIARATLADDGSRATPRACAAAFLAAPVALLGHLPLPRGVRRHEGAYLEPNPPGAPSAAHAALLAASFHPPWPQVVATELADEALRATAYDAYLDRARTRHAGSVVLQRLLVEHAGGERVPVVVVLSIAARVRKCGYGAALFDLACDLLFADLPPSTARGYVVAECLPLRFWAHRLDEGALGRALGHLLAAHFPVHHLLRDECTVRAAVVEREAPMVA
jgi:hypothetical protein